MKPLSIIPLVVAAGLCVTNGAAGQNVIPAKPVDPIVGAWKLNVAKSRLPIVPAYKMVPEKEQIESYRVIDGGRIERTSRTVRTDGSVNSSTFIWPTQGGAVEIRTTAEGTRLGLSYVETLMSPGEWFVTTMLDGRQVGTMHKVVSKDGKTMRQTVRIVDPEGKAVERLQIYDRQ